MFVSISHISLLFAHFSLSHITTAQSTGKKFWTGTKRRPRPVDWNNPIALYIEYLYATSNLYASVWQVEGVRDRDEFESIVKELKLEQPEWKPSGEKVDLSEGDNEEGGDGPGGEDDEKLKGDLYKVDTSKLQPAQPAEFEKDDDLNFHIDFLTTATNMRSWNYDIKASPRHTVKVTAGRSEYILLSVAFFSVSVLF